MTNIDFSEMGARIRKRRKKLGLSQEDLASECNTTRETISKWECGNIGGTEGKVNLGILLNLCECLGIDMNHLLGNDYSSKITQIACEYTGLSENAIDIMHRYAKDDNYLANTLSRLIDIYPTQFYRLLIHINDFLEDSAKQNILSDSGQNVFLESRYDTEQATNLIQCQRQVDSMKNHVQYDSYIIDKAKKELPNDIKEFSRNIPIAEIIPDKFKHYFDDDK